MYQLPTKMVLKPGFAPLLGLKVWGLPSGRAVLEGYFLAAHRAWKRTKGKLFRKIRLTRIFQADTPKSSFAKLINHLQLIKETEGLKWHPFQPGKGKLHGRGE